MSRGIATLLLSAALALGLLSAAQAGEHWPAILAYHRFGPTAADSMTIRSDALAAQLEYLHSNGYTVIPLRRLVDRLNGGGAPLPDKAVVITVDDGHRSVYSELLPLLRRYQVPATLFIYPSAISNASYALTWAQLAELKQSGLIDIQAHTYWHPNFKQEKRRLSAEAYGDFVHMQLAKPRQVLAQRLGVDADLMAWPFGIYDQELLAAAATAGYVAAFTLDRRHPRAGDPPLALPRYLMVDAVDLHQFQRLLEEDAASRR